ncbi:MAG: hypothetical protein ACT4PG_12595 [Panacagrimonas sp.]
MASPKRCIVIADYDPAWPLMFASIRAQLLQAVGPRFGKRALSYRSLSAQLSSTV